MASLGELKSERESKARQLEALGYTCYKTKVAVTHQISELLDSFKDMESKAIKLVITGRIIASRGHGKLMFIDLFDGTGTVQLFIKSDNLGEKFNHLMDLTDRGDFIKAVGTAFTTKRGEHSIMVTDWDMVTKSLLPLPDSWAGLKDDELRYRNRHLDLLQSDDLREVFYKKARFWAESRKFLEDRGFMSVETPTLELTTGGAEAAPFKTHHNDFDIDVYLRISIGELWQKRLMAAGFTKTYEIGRAYRNEGSSPEHLQEFTNCEFYAANLDFESGKALVIELYRTLALNVFGTTTFTTRGHTFDLSNDWQELDYVGTVEKMTGVHVLDASEEELAEKLDELGVKYDGNNRERMMDSLWKYCRKQISGPALLVNHPKLLAPLSNIHPDDDRLTLTFQPILAGSEVGRAHSELNNPVVQRERFLVQQRLLEGGDDEAMMPDWEYVEMMEHGMPPTFGFGYGERLFSFFVDMSIREATLFPFIKPEK